jgi:hypothetical protein
MRTKAPSTPKKSSLKPPNVTAARPPAASPTWVLARRNTSNAKTLVVNAMIGLVAGLGASFSPTDVLELPSGSYTIEQLIAAFTAYLPLVTDVTLASRAYHLAVEKERKAKKTVLALRSQVKAAIEARVGKTSSKMATYGFVPAKVPVRTAKSKMAAIVKGEATREARGTRGSRQKAAITGNVTGIAVTAHTGDNVAPAK